MPSQLPLFLLACVAALPLAAMASQRIDPARSSADFDIDLRIGGDRVRGRLPQVGGALVRMDDGRLRIEMDVDSNAAEVPGQPRYTRMLRGPQFFDTARHPRVLFVSDPFPEEKLRQGGVFEGALTVRGVTRRECLEVLPAACAQPLRDCPLRAHGALLRGRYGMRSLRLVAGEEVRYRFVLNGERTP